MHNAPSPTEETSGGRRASRRRVQLAIAVASFVVVTAVVSSLTGIWQDEWYSLYSTSRGLGFAFVSSVRFEGLPPLYPLVLAAWRVFGDSVFVARALSIVVAALALSIVVAALALVGAMRLASRTFAIVPPIAFVAAYALETVVVFSSIEIRLYAMALCISVWSLAMFVEGYVAEKPSTGARIAHAVLAVAGIYTQYFLGAQVVGEAVALIALGDRSRLRAFATWMVPVVVACVPALGLVRSQLGIVRVPVPAQGATRASLLGPLGALRSFVLPHDFVAGTILKALYALASIGALALVFLARPRLDRAVVVGLSIVGTILAFFLVAPHLLHQSIMYPRHIIVGVAPMLFLAFAAFDGATRRAAVTRRAAFGLYVAFAIPSLLVSFGPLAKPGDFQRAAAYLGTHAAADQTVFVFDQELVGPLATYDRGAHRLVPIPAPMTFERFDARAFALTSDDQAAQAFAGVRSGAIVWLYRGTLCDPTPDQADAYGCRYLERAVDQRFVVLDRRPLYHGSLVELRKT
jgi:hypothetical protein